MMNASKISILNTRFSLAKRMAWGKLSSNKVNITTFSAEVLPFNQPYNIDGCIKSENQSYVTNELVNVSK